MKRRNFIASILGLSGGLSASVVVNNGLSESWNGFIWETRCPLCKTLIKQFVEMGDAVTVKTQCSYCLAALDTTGLSTKIRLFQGNKWKGYRNA